MSVPAHALDAWTVGVERGLPTYALTSEAGEVRLVCDPDRVFGPTPNGAVIVALAYKPVSRVWHTASWASIALVALYVLNATVHYFSPP